MDSKEIKAMIENSISAAVEPLQTELKEAKDELKAARKENDELKEKQKEADDRIVKGKIDAARKSVNDVLDTAIKQKKTTPGNREAYAKQIGVDDDERVVNIDVEQVKQMFGVDKVETEEDDNRAKGKGEFSEIKDPGDRLVRMTKAFQMKHGEKDFKAAFSMVAEAHPDLHREYLDSNGEV